jgi:hypothetical protein
MERQCLFRSIFYLLLQLEGLDDRFAAPVRLISRPDVAVPFVMEGMYVGVE